MSKWIIKNTKADLAKLSENLKIDKLICKIVSNRGITTEAQIERFLNLSEKDLYEPYKMKDMDAAVDLVLKAVSEKRRIRIIGDYDQDGISSTVILYKGLERSGANIDYDTPERTKDGYGINERLVKKASEDEIDLIITCDNGIAANDAVSYAKELGIQVIVTDHHDVPFAIDEAGEKSFILPNADAVVNPKRVDCSYPFKGLCGAGVAFKLIEAVYEKIRIDKKEMDELYEFLALATVCDVMDLIDENRVFVKIGLEKIQNSQNKGLKALIEATNLREKKIGTYHLGFILGPCINASGRLETAKTAIEMFLTEDSEKASEMAKKLVELNEHRKGLTQKGIEEISNQIENSDIAADDIIVAVDESIHESIAGIIAGKIREKYNKPTIVITASEEESEVKASGRSIEEYDMFSELSKQSDLFLKFGGHPMAAGFSMKRDNVCELRKRLNECSNLTEEDLVPKIYLDAHIPVSKVDMSLPSSLEVLEPFGKGNPRPIFGDKSISVQKADILGKNYRVFKFRLAKESRNNIEAIYFGDIEAMQSYMEKKFGELEFQKALRGEQNDIELDIVYYPSINEYNGRRSVQIVIQDYR